MGGIDRQTWGRTATIANAATKSEAVGIKGIAGGGFVALNGVEGSAMTFEVSADGTHFYPLRKNTANEDVSIAFTVDKAYPLPDEIFGGWTHLKFVTSSQTGVGTIVVVGSG